MSRRGSTGEIRVDYFTGVTPASLAAPSLATDLASGVPLTPHMRRDGLETPRSASTIDTSVADSRQDTEAPGNIAAGRLVLKLQRNSVTADDDAWVALPEDNAGLLVVRRFGGSSAAFAAAQKVETYLVTVSTREMQPIGDKSQDFVVTFTVADQEQDATIAA